ncbi:MAG: CheB methylesterase domain-containing protein, partial [Candidatus Acidiferrales bacterium]
DESSMIHVREACSGVALVAGQALICPGNRHLAVRRSKTGHIAVVSDSARVNGHRPSADVLFRSVAKEFGDQSIALLMTGMGNDGVEAIRTVRDAGGLTLAQDSSSCVVDSMPRSATERGYVMRVVDLEALPNFLYAQCAVDQASVVGNRAEPTRIGE